MPKNHHLAVFLTTTGLFAPHRMGTITLRTLVDEQTAKGIEIESRPARRAMASPVATKPLRTSAPNSVFAFGRSFAA